MICAKPSSSLSHALIPFNRGNSALSPSGNTLAVANLQHTVVHWYSLLPGERGLLHWTPYQVDGHGRYFVDIQLLDNETVVRGSCGSQIIFARLRLGARNPFERFKVPGAGGKSFRLPVLTYDQVRINTSGPDSRASQNCTQFIMHLTIECPGLYSDQQQTLHRLCEQREG